MSRSVKMRKNNRIVDVEVSRAETFLNRGYDQIDENGEIVKRATGGRAISLAEHNKVIEELETLKKSPADTDELNKRVAELEVVNDELKKENSALKGKVTKLEKEINKNSEEPQK